MTPAIKQEQQQLERKKEYATADTQTDAAEEPVVAPKAVTSEAEMQTEVEELFTEEELQAAAEPTPPRSLAESHSQTDFAALETVHAEAQTVPRQASEQGAQTEAEQKPPRVDTISQTDGKSRELADAPSQVAYEETRKSGTT